MVKESASKIKQDNTTQMILVKNDNRQGRLEGLSCLSYTPIKAYRTAVLGRSRDLLRAETEGRIGMLYCTIGLFQIVILRMVSVSILVVCEEHVSRVGRVGVTDGSSLVVLRARLLRWFVLRVFLLRAVGLAHRRYK